LRPARIGSSPSAPWKYRTNTNVSAKRDRPLRNAAPVAAEKPRSANSDRSSIGDGERRSTTRNAGSRTTARASATRVLASVQLTMPPREIP
jgi:hypothetical protein